jgi:hypothetical protein
MRRIDMMRLIILLSWLFAPPVFAAEAIEAIGAEKCGRGAKTYTVEFLAPDNAQVEAQGKVLVAGKEEPDKPSLSLDGKPCSNGRCAFPAKKGQTYKLTAVSTARALELCISVSRP